MTLIRSIGKWALAGLMVNAMIGSGIFGVPGELINLLGAASPGAFIVAGLAMSVIVACFVEVASQFPAAGGPYLYARTAFGRPAGLQVAWFSALAPIAAAAAQANLFVNYLAGFQPALGEGLARFIVIAGLIGVLAFANSMGANAGKTLSSILVIIKLLPLAVLIAVGLTHVGVSDEQAVKATSAAYGPSNWFTAALLAAVCFGGFEDPLATAGEVTDPRRSIGFALGVSLAICIALYALIQLITVRALGPVATPHPLATVAGALLGSGGAAFVACAVMVSTAGAISAVILSVPRIVFALASHGDFAGAFARVHGPRNSPVRAILLVSSLIFGLAISGTYRWALAITAGATMVMCGSVCACLIRLRKLQYDSHATRIRFGIPVAVLGVILSLLLVAQLEPREAALIWVVVLLAGAHWLWVRQIARTRTG